MVKKPTILLFGGSSGIARELKKFFKKKYNLFMFYNKGKIKNDSNLKRVKLNLLNNKEINLKLNKINFTDNKIIIINFASIKIDKLSLYVNNKDIQDTFQVNTFSFLTILKKLLPIMIRKKWGRVINISSTGGQAGDRGTLLYSASKNSTLSMMKVMSKEYATFNITFNTLVLGNFNYGLFNSLKERTKEDIIKKIPSNKLGKVSNIYNGIKFLIDSEYVNGSSINIDGGYLN